VGKDAVIGLVCLAGSAILYSTLGLIEEQRATFFPRTVIIIMGILAALLTIQGLILKKAAPAKGAGYPWARFFSLLAIILAYLGISEYVGFYLSAFLFFLAVILILGWQKLNPRKSLMTVVSSAVFTAILFILFKVILEVQTPRGIFY